MPFRLRFLRMRPRVRVANCAIHCYAVFVHACSLCRVSRCTLNGNSLVTAVLLLVCVAYFVDTFTAVVLALGKLIIDTEVVHFEVYIL